jgi:ABC-2 type transport system permease protein
MRRAIAVALWEVKAYLRDRADLAFSLLVPVAIFAIMYGAFGGQTRFNGTANIVNEDDGIYATRLIEAIDGHEGVRVALMSREAAESKLEGDMRLAVFIPADFSSNLLSGRPAELTFIQQGNGGIEGQIVAGIVRAAADDINNEFRAKASVEELFAGTGISRDHIVTTVERFVEREAEQPLVSIEETAIGSDPSPVSQFLPGVLTMFVLFAVTLSAQVIVEERRKGTLERLLTTRLTVGELFFGKFLSGTARALVQTALLLTLTYIVFRLFTPLTFLEALVVAVAFAAAASAFGLLIASISRTPDQAIWVSVLFTMLWTILGGTFFTAEPGTLFDVLARFSLNSYANNALKAIITEGRHLSSVTTEIAVILGVAIVVLLFSRLVFKAVPGGK